MRLGDEVNGYLITTPPTNAGAGTSQWAFAEKGGAEYFVKMFLAPKHPTDETLGSEAVKERKRAACLAFEQRHLAIQARIDPSAPGGGNLVATRDFFRVESTYYKVTDKVDAVPVPAFEGLTPRQRIVLLRTLVFSVSLLHERGIVHSDLKVDNVLVQPAGDGLFTTKLIDFDEAYIVGSPPTPDLIVGDPGYYSPELLRYIKGDGDIGPGDLGPASDMFSLGLLLHALLCGGPPGFDRARFAYPCEAVVAGAPLDQGAAPAALADLLQALAAPRPGDRPDVTRVIQHLRTVDPEALARRRAPAPVATDRRRPLAPPDPTPPSGELKGRLGRDGGRRARPRPDRPTPSLPTRPGPAADLRSTIKRHPRPDDDVGTSRP